MDGKDFALLHRQIEASRQQMRVSDFVVEMQARKRAAQIEQHVRNVLFSHGIVNEKKATLNGRPIQLVFVSADHLMTYDRLSQIIVDGKIYWEGCM